METAESSHTRNPRTRSFTSIAMSQSSPSSSRAPPPPPPLGSPPPYSPEPPAHETNSFISVKRATSSPHLQSPPQSPRFSDVYAQSSSSHRPSTTSLHSQISFRPRSRSENARSETEDDDTDTALSGDDVVVYRSRSRERTREAEREPSRLWTLRDKLFGKGKGRADAAERARFITTARGVTGAGETETESEDVPRNLPTARLTGRTAQLSPLITSPLAESMSFPIPSNGASSRQRASLALGPLLFEFSRWLSIVPAAFGTAFNIYFTLFPPNGSLCWRLERAVCTLWSVLTGWQCLQLTTGLFKRWQVYYSPLPTLIRLFALQAICWPANHFTLTILDYEVRPLICWAAIGTTTCCSRSIQMWVTSNIVEPPGAQELVAKHRSRRRWDWDAVLWACVLPAGVVYCVMAWMLVLRHEFKVC